MREQQLASLRKGMQTLQRQFEDKKQESMEKLVHVPFNFPSESKKFVKQEKKFEHYLAKDGKFSPDKLVMIFEEIHYSGLASAIGDYFLLININ